MENQFSLVMLYNGHCQKIFSAFLVCNKGLISGSIDWAICQGKDEVSHNVPPLQIHKMHLTTTIDLTQLQARGKLLPET